MTTVAVVTPMDERSAIAKVTVPIVEALSAEMDVEILAEPSNRPLATSVPVRPLTSPPPAASLARFDHTILVLGNSPYHRMAYQIARTYPATLILHDIAMADLAYAVDGPGLMAHMLRSFYQDPAVEEAAASLSTSRPFVGTALVERFPMVEAMMHHARGVIVHSEFAKRSIQGRTIVPVNVLPLPVPPETVSRSQDSADQSMTNDVYTISTIGHANRNKQHELIIEAIAALPPLDRRVRYVIAGAIGEGRKSDLMALAHSLGLSNEVECTGHLSDQRLDAVLSASDICANLRRPPVEGASASVLEQMVWGRPVVVMDHGSYEEIPDDIVCKVPPSIDPQGLAEVFRELLLDPARRVSIGAQARSHVLSRHTPAMYATRLAEVLLGVDGQAAIVAALRRVAATTRLWHMSPTSSLPGRPAGALLDLLNDGTPPVT